MTNFSNQQDGQGIEQRIGRIRQTSTSSDHPVSNLRPAFSAIGTDHRAVQFQLINDHVSIEALSLN
jgi:hypothetical protein